jgi:segregation and condensation protein B
MNKLKSLIEAIILTAQEPVSLAKLANLLCADFGIFTEEIQEIIEQLKADHSDGYLELVELASGYRFQTRAELAHWINKLADEKPPTYSRALLEVLGIILYRQPITRGEIEEIRGIAVSTNIIKTLLEHGWVKIAGVKNTPGKPPIYVTTDKFLQHFNLKSLNELPALEDFAVRAGDEANMKQLELEL